MSILYLPYTNLPYTNLPYTNLPYTKNKISMGLDIITKARRYLNRETLLKLYNAFVFPYLTYCVEVWGTAPKKYLDPLIKIQKKIVRIITFLRIYVILILFSKT